MNISLVVPNRNNLRYFKWMYDSVRKNQGNHEVWICSAVDACTDGTLEYYQELEKKDPFFKYIVNEGPERVGHTILYDRIVNELVETDLAMIWHCDMYLAPGALDAIEKLMYDSHGGRMMRQEERYGRIVSLTRIEPPLHPPGPEKIVCDFGDEPEKFNENELLNYIKHTSKKYVNTITEGVFAPWCFWVDEFKEIGGHDHLFAPQSKEDSDIFNRFMLNGTKFIQTWEGFVYHMTCRGSRRNTMDGAKDIHTNNPEWEAQNLRSSRNFVRKWGHFIKHDQYMNPIIPHKYNIGIVLTNASSNLLYNLEIWCDHIQVDLQKEIVDRYIEFEQINTKYDLTKRINTIKELPDIIVEVNGAAFTQDDMQNIINLSEIITNSCNEPGEYELGALKVNVRALNHYEQNLIKCTNEN